MGDSGDIKTILKEQNGKELRRVENEIYLQLVTLKDNSEIYYGL